MDARVVRALAWTALLLAALVPQARAAGSAPTFGDNYSAGADDDWMYFAWPIDPQGSATTYRFEYRAAGEVAWASTPERALASTSGLQTTPEETVTGVAPSTDYVFRVVASNEFGTSQSPEAVTQTKDPGPLAGNGRASEVTATSARLAGSVDPRGNQTSWRFEYGTAGGDGALQTAPGGAAIPAAYGATPVSVLVEGLQPATRYRFRLRVAANTGGYPEPIEFVEFETAAAPAPAPVESAPGDPGAPVQPGPDRGAASPSPSGTGTAGTAARLRAAGRYCRSLSRQRLRSRPSPFALCVRALRPLHAGRKHSPQLACRALARRPRRGQRRSDYAACVAAARLLLRDRSRALSSR